MTRNRAEASAEQGRQQAAGSRTQNARARVTNTNPDIHRNTDLWISSLPAKWRQDRSHVSGDPEGKQMLTNIQPSQSHRGTIYPSLPVRALTLQTGLGVITASAEFVSPSGHFGLLCFDDARHQSQAAVGQPL